MIADSYVDINFGTGVLKITPSHDINDYNLSLKHNLPNIMILNKDGTMNQLVVTLKKIFSFFFYFLV